MLTDGQGHRGVDFKPNPDHPHLEPRQPGAVSAARERGMRARAKRDVMEAVRAAFPARGSLNRLGLTRSLFRPADAPEEQAWDGIDRNPARAGFAAPGAAGHSLHPTSTIRGLMIRWLADEGLRPLSTGARAAEAGDPAQLVIFSARRDQLCGNDSRVGGRWPTGINR